MRVKITLNEASRAEAIRMRGLRNITTPADFEGPDFAEVEDLGSDGSFVSILLVDGTTYFYPVSSIARIASYP